MVDNGSVRSKAFCATVLLASPIKSRKPQVKLVHIGGDHKVWNVRLSSGVTQNMTLVYVKMMPMLVTVPEAMSRSVNTMNGPVAPVSASVITEFALAISDAATIKGA